MARDADPGWATRSTRDRRPALPLSSQSSSMEPLTDAQAVRAVLAGQHELYAVLVRRYQDVLFAHAFRMVGGRDEAADVVQRALVRGFDRLASCRQPDRVGGWLFRILANECRDRLRAR